MSGTIDINLDKFSNTINNSVEIGEEVSLGIADQGALIGQAIGVTIAVLLFFALIFVVISFIRRFISTTKGLGFGAKR